MAGGSKTKGRDAAIRDSCPSSAGTKKKTGPGTTRMWGGGSGSESSDEEWDPLKTCLRREGGSAAPAAARLPSLSSPQEGWGEFRGEGGVMGEQAEKRGRNGVRRQGSEKEREGFKKKPIEEKKTF